MVLSYWLMHLFCIVGANRFLVIEKFMLVFICSYAEMAKEEKNKISHRSKALAMVKSHFAEAKYTFHVDTSL